MVTYGDIASALASEGITCRQESMGGGCAALVVEDPRGGTIIIGNGEWKTWDPLSEDVWGSVLAVLTETPGGEYSGDSDRYALCTTAYGVLAVVSALLNGGRIDCAECGEAHDVLTLQEDTRDVDPMPTFPCPL